MTVSIYPNARFMKRTCILFLLPLLLGACSEESRYTDPQLPVEKRVEDLLSRMSVEEKVAQVSAQLLFMDEFYEKRDYTKGHVRNVGHFLPDGGLPNDPKTVAERINEDTQKSIEASRWGIPVLQHGEALHGAQWGSATCFPQSIAMGATFDEDLYYEELMKRVATSRRKESGPAVFADTAGTYGSK